MICNVVMANTVVHRIRYDQSTVRAMVRITTDSEKIEHPAPCLLAGMDGEMSRRKY